MVNAQILVHAGTGGVGLAALQVASRLGLCVLATASNPAKRALLRKLGAAAALGSRDTTFADALACKALQGVFAIYNNSSVQSK